jgi:uncharacterized protein YjiS (DUF1127 family)
VTQVTDVAGFAWHLLPVLAASTADIFKEVSMFVISALQASTAPLLAAAILKARKWRGAYGTALQRRRTYLALSALDDHALHDIGLSRTMVLSASIHGTRSGMSGSPGS